MIKLNTKSRGINFKLKQAGRKLNTGGKANDKTYFIYNLCKYEKHPKKGILELKFSKKYVFNTKEEITQIGKEIKSINNDYMEQMVILHIPAIVEKEF